MIQTIFTFDMFDVLINNARNKGLMFPLINSDRSTSFLIRKLNTSVNRGLKWICDKQHRTTL